MSESRKRNWVKSFVFRTDGGMIILGMFLFVAMIFAASLAIDLARYEEERVRLQGVADRAVLAAGSIRYDGDGGTTKKDFVRDYFVAAGYTLDQFENWIEITDPTAESPAGEIRVTPQTRLSTMLMGFVGIDSLDMPINSAARIPSGREARKLEIVLVLDISGSMSIRSSNGLTRLDNLKNSAVTLVSDLMDGRPVGDVAISIAPYESWVMVGDQLLSTMNTTSGNGHCADFQDWNEISDFRGNGNAAHARNRGLARANAVRNARSVPMQRANCGTITGFRAIELLMTDKNEIINNIYGLTTMGTTSIDLGVRYGAMLFDSDLRPYVNSEINAGRIHESMRNRPAGVDDEDVQQFMVIMTDGENCCGARGTPDQLDQNTRSVCDNLRAEGIPVFAVAFEAPPRGASLMRYCASSDGHYFNSAGAGLAEAFQAIGRQINTANLRLIP